MDGLDLTIARGEIAALVGESGSGKTMTAFCIPNLLPPAARITAGTIRLGGTEVLSLPPSGLRSLRGRKAALAFPEPMTSLNPLLPIGRQIAEMIRCHAALPEPEVAARVMEPLEQVRMPDARRRVNDDPHSLSGGLRQRVTIAIALACAPDLPIADEPTKGRDVTIQAQILKLIPGLRDRTGMAVLLITPDLGVVSEVADRVAVMYGRRIVEAADVATLFRSPRHPCTRGLLDGRPARARSPGSAPSPRAAPRSDPCATSAPPFAALGATMLGCHFPQGAP